jgi:hypothetical protein
VEQVFLFTDEYSDIFPVETAGTGKTMFSRISIEEGSVFPG